jgi:hypothetical membrane protein
MAGVINARRATAQRVLLPCGVIAACLFVVVFLIAGAIRPDYSPLRHPVSSLALGDAGWVQVANFLVTGGLMVAFAGGLRAALRRYGAGIWAPLLVALVGIGLIGAGVFPADPVSGYPPGSPMVADPTTLGTLHNTFSSLVFLGLPVACVVVAYRFVRSDRKAWAAYSAGTAVVFLAGFVLAGIGFAQDPTLMPIGGLLQRLTLIVGMSWLAALAIHLRSAAGGLST